MEFYEVVYTLYAQGEYKTFVSTFLSEAEAESFFQFLGCDKKVIFKELRI